MLKLLLLRLWPALIPLAIYGIWLLWLFRRDAEKPPSALLRRRLFQAVVLSGILVIASLFWLGITAESTRGQRYIPPHYDGDRLIPAHTEKREE